MAKITDTMIGQIIQAIGGRDNITHCGHCMTRLRLSLADSLHADAIPSRASPASWG
ncbi:PTS transporter subunit EIIB [Aeromonas caviae]|uniref:PTS transporter subunit EIIB n=1 Tax=Aeromonas caviae TaxID=648 RepID=UPI0038D21606